MNRRLARLEQPQGYPCVVARAPERSPDERYAAAIQELAERFGLSLDALQGRLAALEAQLRVTKGRLGKQDAEIQQTAYLTRKHLNAALGTSERVCPKQYPFHLVMATAGLRLGETLALQVGDLDAPALKIHVRRAYRKGHVSSPKSGKVRVVDVGETTMQALVKVREIRQAEAAVRGTEARWLSPSPTGDKPLSDFAVRRALYKALKAASLPRVNDHTLRHTYASLESQAGVPLLTVSRQLGRAGIAATAGMYSHLGPQSNRVAAEAMEGILTGNQTQPPRSLTL